MSTTLLCCVSGITFLAACRPHRISCLHNVGKCPGLFWPPVSFFVLFLVSVFVSRPWIDAAPSAGDRGWVGGEEKNLLPSLKNQKFTKSEAGNLATVAGRGLCSYVFLTVSVRNSPGYSNKSENKALQSKKKVTNTGGGLLPVWVVWKCWACPRPGWSVAFVSSVCGGIAGARGGAWPLPAAWGGLLALILAWVVVICFGRVRDLPLPLRPPRPFFGVVVWYPVREDPARASCFFELGPHYGY